MKVLRKRAAPAVAVLSAVVAVGSRILDGVDAVQLGLPFWAWEAIGLFVFLAAILAVVSGTMPDQQRQFTEPETGVPTPDTASDATAAGGFDPYRYMSSKIMRVDCTGLWAAEHDRYIDFVVYVTQTSPWEVALTDVQGRIRIGPDECSLPARLVNSPRKLGDPRGLYDCTIRQSLTQEMAMALVWNPGKLNLWREDAHVRISLAGLKWIGTVALPHGTVALSDRVVCEEDFAILGPVQEGDKDKVLIRGGILLISQVWRHQDSGALREQAGATPSSDDTESPQPA